MKKIFVFVAIICLVALAAPTMAQTGAVGTDTLIAAKTNSGEYGTVGVPRTSTGTTLEINFSSGASAGEVTIYVAGSTTGEWCVWGVFTPADEPHYVYIPVKIGAVKAAITSTVTGKTVTVTRYR